MVKLFRDYKHFKDLIDFLLKEHEKFLANKEQVLNCIMDEVLREKK